MTTEAELRIEKALQPYGLALADVDADLLQLTLAQGTAESIDRLARVTATNDVMRRRGIPPLSSSMMQKTELVIAEVEQPKQENILDIIGLHHHQNSKNDKAEDVDLGILEGDYGKVCGVPLDYQAYNSLILYCNKTPKYRQMPPEQKRAFLTARMQAMARARWRARRLEDIKVASFADIKHT